MSFDNTMYLKIKCSDFMLKSEHCNDDTLFLIPDPIHKTHTLYLLVSFIYSKYKDLIYLKKDNVALHAPTFGGDTEILSDSNNDVFAFSRKKGKNKVDIIINFTPKTIDINSKTFGKITLAPWGYKINTK